MPYKPTVISTFSGCGGSSLGYKLAGCDVRLAVEWEENAVQTYRHNFPRTTVFHGDIATLSVERALELAGIAAGELDIFDGSPPCQGFSTAAGKRDAGDERNKLFLEYARLLRGLRPRGFIMENVRGMVTGAMRPIFEDVMRTLRGCGYVCAARVLNAKWYGVPQARERVIIVGVRADLAGDPATYKERSHPSPTVQRPVTVREALEGVVIREMPPPLAPRYRQIWHRLRPGRSIKDDVMLKIGSNSFFGAAKVNPDRACMTICKMVRIDGFGGIYHWEEPRVLATEEAQRLASFPDNYEFLGDYHDRWARIGNCVPPLLMRAVAANLRRLIAPADADLTEPDWRGVYERKDVPLSSLAL